MTLEALDKIISNLIQRERRALALRAYALANFYERARFYFTRLRVRLESN